MLFQKNILNNFCVCECEKKFKCNVFSQCEIEFCGYFLAILWNFSDFWEKWGFSYANWLWKIKIFALRIWTVPFRIRKAFVYLQYSNYKFAETGFCEKVNTQPESSPQAFCAQHIKLLCFKKYTEFWRFIMPSAPHLPNYFLPSPWSSAPHQNNKPKLNLHSKRNLQYTERGRWSSNPIAVELK